MLQYAKSQCDYLIVGIDSDQRVKTLKGPTRPINNSKDRADFLLALSAVDEVLVFDSGEELTNLIKLKNPDIMVVGSDYIDKVVIGSQYAKKLFFFNRIEGYSTSKIVKSSGNR